MTNGSVIATGVEVGVDGIGVGMTIVGGTAVGGTVVGKLESAFSNRQFIDFLQYIHHPDHIQ
jgi:hypothetical protein